MKEKKKNETKQIKRNPLFKELRKQLFHHNRIPFFVTVFATIAVAFINLMISWEMQQIVDCMSGNTALSLGQIALVCLGTLLLMILILTVLYFSDPKFVKNAMFQYKQFAFEHVLKKSIHSFQKEDTAAYLSALTTDAASIEVNFLGKAFLLVEKSIMFVGAFCLMLYYSPELTLAAVILSCVPLVASMLAGNQLAKQESVVSKENAGFMGMLKEALNGFPVIKSFQAGKELFELLKQKNEIAESAKCKRRKMENKIQLIGASAAVIAQFGVFLIGAYLALTGKGVTAGTTIVFVQLMNYVIDPISTVPQVIANYKASNVLMNKLAGMIEQDTSENTSVSLPELTDSICLKNVSFGYEEENPVLKDISVSFEAGKSYAIVGGSGSGKSTLLQLLMGNQPNYKGKICYDSTELSQISPEALYGLVSIIQQNVFVFQSSIRDNITMFKPFSKEKIDNAIALAGLTSLVTEHGEDYNCGEGGNGLSGGERQRISIARSLLRETPVLFVDEATAALDAATSFSVSNAILDIPNLTRLVVTHRLEEPLLQRYDEILVLRNGTIEEKGSFSELMKNKGYFYSLFTVAQ